MNSRWRVRLLDPEGGARIDESDRAGLGRAWPATCLRGGVRARLLAAEPDVPPQAAPAGENRRPPVPDPDVFGPAWALNGSFPAYRRPNKDVPAFNRFLEKKAAELAKRRGFQGITADTFGALIVGRWKSGSPVNWRRAEERRARPGRQPPRQQRFRVREGFRTRGRVQSDHGRPPGEGLPGVRPHKEGERSATTESGAASGQRMPFPDYLAPKDPFRSRGPDGSCCFLSSPKSRTG